MCGFPPHHHKLPLSPCEAARKSCVHGIENVSSGTARSRPASVPIRHQRPHPREPEPARAQLRRDHETQVFRRRRHRHEPRRRPRAGRFAQSPMHEAHRASCSPPPMFHPQRRARSPRHEVEAPLDCPIPAATRVLCTGGQRTRPVQRRLDYWPQRFGSTALSRSASVRQRTSSRPRRDSAGRSRPLQRIVSRSTISGSSRSDRRWDSKAVTSEPPER